VLSPFPRKRDFEARDRAAEKALLARTGLRRDRTRTTKPANSGQFGDRQEIYGSARVRGGAGRTRTTKQEIIINFPGSVEPSRSRRKASFVPPKENDLTADFRLDFQPKESVHAKTAGTIETSVSTPVSPCFARALGGGSARMGAQHRRST
jgi:hypothetical protein